MVPQQELICSLELECSRKFGNSKYSFYYPIQLENFLVTCWKTQTAAESTTVITGPSNSFTTISSSSSSSSNSLLNANNCNSASDRYCCTIYEDGSIIQPGTDYRMRYFPWAKSFSKKKDFSKEELETLLKVVVGTPFNVQHKVHVDFDYKWSGQDLDRVFDIQEELGRGSYGTVSKALHRESHFTLAIKSIPIKESAEIEKEITILKKCKSNSIVSYYGSCQQGDNLWILMEYCSLGSVRDMLELTGKNLSEKQIAYIVTQALKGIHYLHTNQIIHRDIKAANILLNEEAIVKLADFGVSAQLDDVMSKSTDFIGTPLWMPPEIIQKKPYNNKCDIWSLGISIIEMAEGTPPLCNMPPTRAMLMIPNKPSPTLEKPQNFSKELSNFISLCCKKDPEERPSALDLLSHPFIQSSNASNGLDIMKPLIDECLKKRLSLVKKKKLADSKNSNHIVNNQNQNQNDKQPQPQQHQQSKKQTSSAGSSVDEEDQSLHTFILKGTGDKLDSSSSDTENDNGTMVFKDDDNQNDSNESDIPAFLAAIKKSLNNSNNSNSSINNSTTKIDNGNNNNNSNKNNNELNFEELKASIRELNEKQDQFKQYFSNELISFRSEILKEISTLLNDFKSNQQHQQPSTTTTSRITTPVRPPSSESNQQGSVSNLAQNFLRKTPPPSTLQKSISTPTPSSSNTNTSTTTTANISTTPNGSSTKPPLHRRSREIESFNRPTSPTHNLSNRSNSPGLNNRPPSPKTYVVKRQPPVLPPASNISPPINSNNTQQPASPSITSDSTTISSSSTTTTTNNSNQINDNISEPSPTIASSTTTTTSTTSPIISNGNNHLITPTRSKPSPPSRPTPPLPLNGSPTSSSTSKRAPSPGPRKVLSPRNPPPLPPPRNQSSINSTPKSSPSTNGNSGVVSPSSLTKSPSSPYVVPPPRNPVSKRISTNLSSTASSIQLRNAGIGNGSNGTDQTTNGAVKRRPLSQTMSPILLNSPAANSGGTPLQPPPPIGESEITGGGGGWGNIQLCVHCSSTDYECRGNMTCNSYPVRKCSKLIPCDGSDSDLYLLITPAFDEDPNSGIYNYRIYTDDNCSWKPIFISKQNQCNSCIPKTEIKLLCPPNVDTSKLHPPQQQQPTKKPQTQKVHFRTSTSTTNTINYNNPKKEEKYVLHTSTTIAKKSSTTNNYRTTFEDVAKTDFIDGLKLKFFREHSQHLPLPSFVFIENEDDNNNNNEETEKNNVQTLDSVKSTIIHPWQIRFIFLGKQLENFSTVADNEILEDSTILVAVSPFNSIKDALEKVDRMTLDDIGNKGTDGGSTTDKVFPVLDHFTLSMNDRSSIQNRQQFSTLEHLSEAETSQLLQRVPGIVQETATTTTPPLIQALQVKAKKSKKDEDDSENNTNNNNGPAPSLDTLFDRMTLNPYTARKSKTTTNEEEKVDPPTVTFSPTNTVTICFGIVAVFSKSIIPIGATYDQLEVPFSVFPPVEGAEWTWIDGVTCKYAMKNKSKLPRSTLYVVAPKFSVFEKVYKLTITPDLVKNFSNAFEISPPLIQFTNFNGDLDNPKVTLTFSQPLKPESFSKEFFSVYLDNLFDDPEYFEFEVEQPLPEKEEESKDEMMDNEFMESFNIKNNVITLKIKEKLELDSEFSVMVHPGILSKEGPNRTVHSQTFNYKTAKKLTCKFENLYEKNNCIIDRPFKFKFSMNNVIKNAATHWGEMTEEEISEYVVVKPPTKVSLAVTGSIVFVKGDFAYGGTYSATIKNFKDIYGSTIEPTSGTITLPLEPKEINTNGSDSFSQNYFFNLDPLSKPNFSFKTKGLSSVKLSAYQVPVTIFQDQPNFYSVRNNLCMGELMVPSNFKLIKSRLVEINRTVDKYSEVDIDLSDSFMGENPKNAQHNFILLRLESGTYSKGLFLQYSPYILSTIETDKTVVVTVTDSSTTETIDEGFVQIYGTSPCISMNKVKNGIAELEKFGDGQCIVYSTTTSQSKRILTAAPYLVDQKEPSNENGVLKIFTLNDVGIYRPGDTANFKGHIRIVSPECELTSSTSFFKNYNRWLVNYVFKDARGQEKVKGTATMNDKGNFTVAVPIPLDINLGTGKLCVTYQEKYKNECDISIQECKRKEFLVETCRSSNSSKLKSDEPFTLEVCAKAYSGEILSSTSVKWSVTINETKPKFTNAAFIFHNHTSNDTHGPFEYTSQRNISGRHTLDLVLQDMRHSANVRISGTITNVTNVYETFSETFYVAAKQYYFGTGKANLTWINSDQKFVRDLIVVDSDGKFSSQGTIFAKIEKIPWEENAPKVKVHEATLIPSSESFISFEHQIQQTGYYRISFEYVDGLGGIPQICESSIFVLGTQTETEKSYIESIVPKVDTSKDIFSQNSKWYAPLYTADLTTHLDKETYQVGDTFKLAITTKLLNCKGFVVVCHRNIISKIEPITIVNGVAEFSGVVKCIPLMKLVVYIDGMVNVQVNGVQVQRYTYDFDSKILDVCLDSKKLNLEIDTKKFQSPNENSIVKVTVRDAQKKPIKNADVTLVVVDESMCALNGTSVKLWDPIETFYSKHTKSMRNYSVLQNTIFLNPKPAPVKVEPQVEPVKKDVEMTSNRITIKYFTGRFLIFNVPNTIPIDQLRALIQERDGLPPAMQRLFYLNKPIPETGGTLEDHGIPNGATINLVIRLSGGGNGDDDKPDPLAAPKIIRVRDNFKPLATYQTDSITNENGEVVFNYTLPDNLTKYRVMAYASTIDMFGSQETFFTSTLPVFIRQSPPRFLNHNDECTFPISVQSIVDFDLKLKLAIQSTTTKLYYSGFKGIIPAKSRIVIPCHLKAITSNTLSTLQIVVSTESIEDSNKKPEEYCDAVKFSFPVHSSASLESVVINGVLSDKKAQIASHPLQFKNWADLDQEVGGLKAIYSCSPFTKLTNCIDYLVDFKYLCSEQLSSKLMALYTLMRLPDLVDSEKLPSKEESQKMSQEMINELEKRMNKDTNGFYYWEDGKSTYPYVDIYVYWVLHVIKQFGATIPLSLRKSFEARMKKEMESFDEKEYKKDGRSYLLRKAFACYLYFISGIFPNTKPGNTMANTVLKHAKKDFSVDYLDIYAFLIPYFSNQFKFETIMQNLTITGSMAYYNSTDIDGFTCKNRCNALLITNLIEFDKKNLFLIKLVQGLERFNNYSGRYGNTQENSFALYAIYRYYDSLDLGEAKLKTTLYLNNFIVEKGDINLDNDNPKHTISVPMKTLIHNMGEIFVSKKGKSPLLYSLILSYGNKNPYQKPINNRGFQITRTYQAINDSNEVLYTTNGSENPPIEIKASARIKVCLTIVAHEDSSFVAVRDYLPAGLEPTNKEKKPYWATHTNIRDNGAEVFADLLHKGSYTFTYTVFALSLGTFIAPPARIEEMYVPMTFGRSKTDIVCVLKK
eukprot:gene679-840_t